MEKDINKELWFRAGPMLTKVLNMQKDQIRSKCYDCVKVSHRNAGEVLASKLIQKNLLVK